MLLVLGMHRSGTSALSGALCQGGLCCPQNPVPPTPANPTGYWESQQIVSFHQSMLRRAGSSWDDPMATTAMLLPENTCVDILNLERALEASFPHWRPGEVALIKEPRQCRLQPVWNQLIEQKHIRVVVVLMVRNPLAVAKSLLVREQIPLERSLLLWLAHTLESEKHTRGQQRCVVSYEQLLKNPAETLKACLQLVELEKEPVLNPEEWIQPGLDHGSTALEDAYGFDTADYTLLELALGVYQRLAAVHGSAPDQSLERRLDQAYGQWQTRLDTLKRQCSRSEIVQLFWQPSSGGGFSEDNAVRSTVEVSRGVSVVTLPLSEKATKPLALRLDPAEQPGLIQFKRLALLGRDGQVLWESKLDGLTPANPHTGVLANGDIVATDDDPALLLDVPSSVLQQLQESSHLLLEACWHPLSQEMASKLLSICITQPSDEQPCTNSVPRAGDQEVSSQ